MNGIVTVRGTIAVVMWLGCVWYWFIQRLLQLIFLRLSVEHLYYVCEYERGVSIPCLCIRGKSSLRQKFASLVGRAMPIVQTAISLAFGDRYL